MATASLQGALHQDLDLVDQWFRALDQRRIYFGVREWHVQVTSILVEEEVLWVQIADGQRQAASVLLRVGSMTSVEQAVRALGTRGWGLADTCPSVISATAAAMPVS
jgi:hypothetical protein